MRQHPHAPDTLKTDLYIQSWNFKNLDFFVVGSHASVEI